MACKPSSHLPASDCGCTWLPLSEYSVNTIHSCRREVPRKYRYSVADAKSPALYRLFFAWMRSKSASNISLTFKHRLKRFKSHFDPMRPTMITGNLSICPGRDSQIGCSTHPNPFNTSNMKESLFNLYWRYWKYDDSQSDGTRHSMRISRFNFWKAVARENSQSTCAVRTP